MSGESLRRFVRLALVTSIVLVATMFFKIVTPTGYIHLGDGIIYAAALAFGGFAAVAGGLGSAMADVMGDFVAWAPWTLAIKAAAGYLLGNLAQVGSGMLIGHFLAPLLSRIGG